MNLRLFLIVTISFFYFSIFGQINLQGNLDFGDYAIGFKQVPFNYTQQTQARNINIALWYPAKRSKKGTLQFKDYLSYSEPLNENELLEELSIGIGGKKGLFPADSLSMVLNASMMAFLNGKAKKGSFPLLLWSSRYGTVPYQSLISEYLASHGYIVAFAEDIPNSPYPWQLGTEVEKESTLDLHIADLIASIDFLKKEKNTNAERIGLLSWSYAGESAILTQIMNTDIDLVVGLSSIGFSGGLYLGSKLKEKIEQKYLEVPYLMLFEKIAPNGNERSLPEKFKGMHPDSRYVYFPDLAHGSFNTLEGMIPGILNTDKVHSWSKGGQVAQRGYESICQATLGFINSIFYGQSFEENLPQSLNNMLPDFIKIHKPSKE